MKFIYPDNLEAPALVIMWKMSSIFIFVAILIIGLLSLSMPIVVCAAVYLVLEIRDEDTSVLDTMIIMLKHVVYEQQSYFYKKVD